MSKSYEDLDWEDLIHFIGEYNNYILEFDYNNAGQPVSTYEFYDNEYQIILAEEN